jgi:hypothetical protein
MPIRLTEGMPLLDQSTPDTGVGSMACRPSDAPQRFFALTIPPERRAVITATPTGSPAWRLVLRVLASCSATECLRDDESATPGGAVTLRVDNFETVALEKILTVSGLAAGEGGSFDLAVVFENAGGGAIGGTVDCGDVVPRLIAPMSSSTVSSRRPLLRWERAPKSVGTRIELCSDPACKNVLETIDSTGTSATPTRDLPPGVVFWRARAIKDGGACTATTPTWEMNVPRRSGTVQSWWGSVPDFNRDGFADVLVGAPGSPIGGNAFEYLGSASGLPATPNAVLPAPLAPSPDTGLPIPAVAFGSSVSSAGDVNGDGYTDAVVGAFMNGRAYVYLGSAAGLATTPATTLVGMTADEFGSDVASAGDVNGDGYGDVLVVATNSEMGGRSYAQVFLGSANGLSTTAATTITAPATGLFIGRGGQKTVTSLDLNADGFSDVVMRLAGFEGVGVPPEVQVFMGSPSGLSSTPAVRLVGTPDSFLGQELATLGDLNLDGFPDLVMTGNLETVQIFLGGPGGLNTTPFQTLPAPPGLLQFGTVLAAGRDLNGDGVPDLLVEAIVVPAVPPASQRALFVYYGTTSGYPTTPSLTLLGPEQSLFGRVLTSLGDVNGDDFPETAVASGELGLIDVFTSGPSGFVPTPILTLVPPGPPTIRSVAGTGG